MKPFPVEGSPPALHDVHSRTAQGLLGQAGSALGRRVLVASRPIFEEFGISRTLARPKTSLPSLHDQHPPWLNP